MTPRLPTHKDLPDSDGAIVGNCQESPQNALLTGCVDDRDLTLEDRDERVLAVADPVQLLADGRDSLLAERAQARQLRGRECGTRGRSDHLVEGYPGAPWSDVAVGSRSQPAKGPPPEALSRAVSASG